MRSGVRHLRWAAFGVSALWIAQSAAPAVAQSSAQAADGPAAPGSPPPSTQPTSRSREPGSGFLSGWFNRVQAGLDSQPDWVRPVGITTPLLEEAVLYDQVWQHMGDGADLRSFGGGKGLALMPTVTNEVVLGFPPYEQRTGRAPASGLADWQFLLIKQRFVSANAQNGDYVVTGFLSVQAPTGIARLTDSAWRITPNLAAGKGWGRFDIQATAGAPLPFSRQRIIGYAITTNVALQYHLGQYFWPELEENSTSWTSGLRSGKTQVFLTPGLILGRFPLAGLKLVIGVGYQTAVTPRMTTVPVLTPTYRQAWILAVRTPF